VRAATEYPQWKSALFWLAFKPFNMSLSPVPRARRDEAFYVVHSFLIMRLSLDGLGSSNDLHSLDDVSLSCVASDGTCMKTGEP